MVGVECLISHSPLDYCMFMNTTSPKFQEKCEKVGRLFRSGLLLGKAMLNVDVTCRNRDTVGRRGWPLQNIPELELVGCIKLAYSYPLQ